MTMGGRIARTAEPLDGGWWWYVPTSSGVYLCVWNGTEVRTKFYPWEDRP